MMRFIERYNQTLEDKSNKITISVELEKRNPELGVYSLYLIPVVVNQL